MNAPSPALLDGPGASQAPFVDEQARLQMVSSADRLLAKSARLKRAGHVFSVLTLTGFGVNAGLAWLMPSAAPVWDEVILPGGVYEALLAAENTSVVAAVEGWQHSAVTKLFVVAAMTAGLGVGIVTQRLTAVLLPMLLGAVLFFGPLGKRSQLEDCLAAGVCRPLYAEAASSMDALDRAFVDAQLAALAKDPQGQVPVLLAKLRSEPGHEARFGAYELAAIEFAATGHMPRREADAIAETRKWMDQVRLGAGLLGALFGLLSLAATLLGGAVLKRIGRINSLLGR